MSAPLTPQAAMILPTPEFDPLFTEDGVPFQDKMWERIRQDFADLLGPQLCKLESDEALTRLISQPPSANFRPKHSDAA